MNNVNWWLMVLAFVLGLALTAVMMIRRVKLEVPIHQAAGGTSVSGGPATARFASSRVDAEASTTEMRVTEGDSPGKLTGAARGSVRAVPGGSGPAGYPIKANEETMAYHTPGSPSFERTIADLWFKDEKSAVAAGFTRWNRAAAESGTAEISAPQHDSIPKPATFVGGGQEEEMYEAGAKTSTAKAPAVQAEPYGAGSVRTAGGAAPEGYTVKGNEDSMLYHTLDSPSYKQTKAEVWFRDEKSAVHAGFAPWHKGRKK